MAKSIYELVDDLPKRNITVMSLRSLDFIIPGQWENIVGFEDTIRHVTGETDEGLIQAVGERAIALYNDKSEGYQTAMWLYQTVDRMDGAIASAALANMVGEKIKLLGFLNKLTPNSEKLQALDLGIKTVVELVAFCKINGIPGDSIGDFARALADYEGVSLMRMAALVCFDGLIPLGPNFIDSVQNKLAATSPSDLDNNPAFQTVGKEIPASGSEGRLSFIKESFNSVAGWMGNFVNSKNLTREKVAKHLQQFVDVSDDKLDYLAAFLDMSTNYFEHTGTQTLARRLIERAMAEI